MRVRNSDEEFMAAALKLAKRGLGYTSPNPAVGSVVVKSGQIIAGDYHRRAGEPHAEALALKRAGEAARGADLYVTLEPCSFHGRTPPCTEAIIAAGIRRVVIGTIDPNPKVNGQGIKALRKNGLEVLTGILAERCWELNRAHAKFMTRRLPLVTVKYAQSLDGRLATITGSSQWISSDKSLKYAHRLRAQHDAVLVGARTAKLDNPQLTVRYVKGRNPIRLIITNSGKISRRLRLLKDKASPVLIVTGRAGARRLAGWVGPKTEIMILAAKDGKLDLHDLLVRLGEREITSLLVEGGAEIITGFLKQNLADRIITIIAPILIGEGISAVGDLSIRLIDQAKKLTNVQMRKIGPDCAIIGDLN